MGYGALETDNFTKILAYECPTGAYPSGDFYQIFMFCGQLHARPCIRFLRVCLRVFRVRGFMFRDVNYPKFSETRISETELEANTHVICLLYIFLYISVVNIRFCVCRWNLVMKRQKMGHWMF